MTADIDALRQAIGPRTKQKEAPTPTAPWAEHLTEEEAARLKVLDSRLANSERVRKDTQAERSRIMNRCIRRGRRKQGKN